MVARILAYAAASIFSFCPLLFNDDDNAVRIFFAAARDVGKPLTD